MGSGRLGVMSHHGEGGSHSAVQGQTQGGCLEGFITLHLVHFQDAQLNELPL